MKVCQICLGDILDDAAAMCPTCGAPCETPAEASEPAAAALDMSEEAVRFRCQFEERKVHLPERILARAEQVLAAARDEARHATVVFAGMRGYASAGRQMTADGFSNLAEEFCRICSDCVLRRGGFTVQFVGAGVLAVFGAPLAYDRDTENAVLAALDIREQTGYWGARQETGRTVGIGIATGLVRSGLAQGGAGKVYSVMGQAVNLASALLENAGDNEILICSDTRGMVGPHFDLAAAGPFSLDGIATPCPAWRVLQPKAQPAQRRLFDMPFCGREREMEAITAALKRAPQTGKAVQTICVIGEAGMGKTCLVIEALKRARLDQAAIWWSGAPSAGAILLHPVLEWLRSELQLTSSDRPDYIQSRIRQWLIERLGNEEADPLPLEYLFGLPDARQTLHGASHEVTQRNLFALLRQLLLHPPKRRAGAQEIHDVILVADDAHWYDPLTLRFLESLAASPNPPGAAARLTLIFTCRSGGESVLESITDRLNIRLGPMGDAECRALLRSLSLPEGMTLEIRGVAIARASGNPFFLQEIIRLIRDLMRDQPSLKGAKLKDHVAGIIPASLRELIQSRIDRLDQPLRQVMQCASVIGTQFAFSILSLFESIHDNLPAHLQTLRDLEYLEEQEDSGVADPRYSFAHSLFRDVAYGTLPDEQKRTLHLNLARRMETVLADRIQEYYDLLAYHFTKAEESAKALFYCVKAADRQFLLGETSNAIQNYHSALAMLQQIEPAQRPKPLQSRILNCCGRLLRLKGDMAQAETALAQAVTSAEAIGNPRLKLEARLEATYLRVWQDENKDLRSELDSILAEAARSGAVQVEIAVLTTKCVMHNKRGEYQASLEAGLEIMRKAERAQSIQSQADAANNLGVAYSRLGDTAKALEAFISVLPLRRKTGDRYGACATLLNIGIIQEQLGEAKAARQSYLNALRLAEQIEYMQVIAYSRLNLSNLERLLAEPAAAREHAIRAVECARAIRDSNAETYGEINWGLACMALDDALGARSHLERARELAGAARLNEAGVSIRLHLLRLESESGGAINAEAVKEGADRLLAEIEANHYETMKPRAWRMMAWALENLGTSHGDEARKHLIMARDLAQEHKFFFEEMDSWRALEAFCRRQSDSVEACACAEAISRMEDTLNKPRSGAGGNAPWH